MEKTLIGLNSLLIAKEGEIAVERERKTKKQHTPSPPLMCPCSDQEKEKTFLVHESQYLRKVCAAQGENHHSQTLRAPSSRFSQRVKCRHAFY